MSVTTKASPPTPLEFAVPGAKDTHLHSTAKINGYATAALDGEIGYVEDFIVDT